MLSIRLLYDASVLLRLWLHRLLAGLVGLLFSTVVCHVGFAATCSFGRCYTEVVVILPNHRSDQCPSSVLHFYTGPTIVSII